jgi:predicted HNH restriction endonuclease
MACGFNFEAQYGELGKGFIHVHHNKPISEMGPTRINPYSDLSVLCPNCHAMIHRKKDRTLSVEELKEKIGVRS